MKTKFSELIETTPAESLLVGTSISTDRDNRANTAAIIEGTPAGFRMLAEFLVSMADSVESGKAQGNGWHLSLSPDDIPAVCTHEVDSLSLGCRPASEFRIEKSTS